MIENHRFWTQGTFKQLSWKKQFSRIFFHFKPIFDLMLLGYTGRCFPFLKLLKRGRNAGLLYFRSLNKVIAVSQPLRTTQTSQILLRMSVLISACNIKIAVSSTLTMFTESSCLRCVPIENAHNNFNVPCSHHTFFGKLVLPTDIPVGSYFPSDFYIEVWNNGSHSTGGKEALQIQAGCSTDWVHYTRGDPIPANALLGGYLGNPSIRTSIITESNHGNCGYHNVQAQRGYTSEGEISTSVSLYILVLNQHWIVGNVEMTKSTLIARFMGPTWGPSGADRT